MLDKGIKGRTEQLVTADMSADRIGSGLAKVFATPMMVALIERTCSDSVQPFLADGESTVGTHVDIKHTAATPIGMTVWCNSELEFVDGPRLTFRVEVFDESGPVGYGTHKRYIVNGAKFQAKADAKLLHAAPQNIA
ncbi:MAG: thioesterase family protein [Bacteroidales bacterium]|nr:thioesterase family protein [Bacteroidales bacterium]